MAAYEQATATAANKQATDRAKAAYKQAEAAVLAAYDEGKATALAAYERLRPRRSSKRRKSTIRPERNPAGTPGGSLLPPGVFCFWVDKAGESAKLAESCETEHRLPSDPSTSPRLCRSRKLCIGGLWRGFDLGIMARKSINHNRFL